MSTHKLFSSVLVQTFGKRMRKKKSDSAGFNLHISLFSPASYGFIDTDLLIQWWNVSTFTQVL